MTRKWSWIPGGIVLLFAVGAAVAAGQAAWHDSDGHSHRAHGGHAVFIGEDDATSFDLSELADGEVRVFGSGDKRVTVERKAGEVAIIHGDADRRSVTCRVDRDTCKILTFDEDPEKVMIVVEKNLECRNGVGDCDPEVEVGAIAAGKAHVVIEKLVGCEPDDECAQQIDVVIAGSPDEKILADEGANVFLRRLGGTVQLLELGDADHALLRCPEGDATLRVRIEEAQDTFLCPKHSVPLEQAATPGRIKVIHEGQARDY